MAKDVLQIVIDATVKGKRDVEGLNNEFGKMPGAAAGAKGAFGKLATGLGTVAAVAAGVAVAAKAVWDQMEQGATLNAARERFDNLAESIGTTGDAMMGTLKEATKGMISDAELVATGAQIISLGLGKTEEDVGRLAKAVGGLGISMDILTLTLANNSVMRLDSLGLSVEGVTKKAKELEDQGFVGDAFDEAVLISLEEKMLLLGDASETASGKIQILKAAFADNKNEVKQWLAEAGDPFLDWLIRVTGANDEVIAAAASDRIEDILASSNSTIDAVRRFEKEFGKGVLDPLLNGDMLSIDIDGAKIFAYELEDLNKQVTNYGNNLSDLNTIMWEAETRQQNAAAAAEAAGADMVLLKDITHSADNAATDYNLTLEELAQLGRAALPDAVDNINQKLMEQEIAAARAEEEMRALNARMGTYFDQAINATGPAESLASIMYNAGMNAGLNAEQMAILAGATGEFTDAQIEAALKTAFMTEQIDLMVKAINEDFTVEDAVGALGLLEDGLATSADEAMRLWDEMNKIPAEVNSRVVVTYKTDKSEWLPPPDAPPSNWSGPSGTGQNDSGAGNSNGARAYGGPVSPFGSYLVGEMGPELFVPATAGNIIPNGQIGGGHTINIYVSGGGRGAQQQAQQIATAVTDALGRLN